MSFNAKTSGTVIPPRSSQYVGPYLLQKTLGKGQTGLVKLGVHYVTGDKVAIKIVNREALSESVLLKVEREIAIMKLIEHPHVLRIHDVYESRKYLYLILEHVAGGELFDYLVKKGRLTPKEARKFFRQIISALDFCHSHMICHRDLKPENLLLDDKMNIRVADFGMASLQVEGGFLETSCGSPHYACPEVIKGEKYDGRKADVWSCGVILYALLVGALPFDDDNLRQLLEKVKKGIFHIPHFVPVDCQQLLRGMIEIDPNKRLTLEDVSRHPWVTQGSKADLELELPMVQVVQTIIIPKEEDIDTDVFAAMTSLGCFKDRQRLLEGLLNSNNKTISANNTPSVSPCSSPTIVKKDVFSKITAFTTGKTSVENQISSVQTPPSTQHHIHRHHRNTSTVSQNDNILTTQPSTQSIACNSISDQSYASAIKDLTTNNATIINNGTVTYHPTRQQSTSASTTSESMNMELSPSILSNNNNVNNNSNSSITSSSMNNNQWRHKLTNLKQSFQNVGTPRFHRRPKVLLTESDSTTTSNSPSQYGTTPEATKKSLFHHIIDAMQEDHHMIVVKDRPLSAIKTDLIHAFLSTPDLVHNVLSGTQYRCEYRRADRSSMFQRNIRFHVEICTVKSNDSSATDSYYVTFTLITGQARRFKKLCEEIQTLFLTSKDRLAKQRRQTNENRPINTNTNSTTTTTATNRSNASFISSLFGNTNSSYVKSNVSQQQQQSSSSSASSLSSTSNISLTNPPLPINDDPSAIESNRIKFAHRPAV
ncbi:unnamed protein product [Adineta steineri]|uniref:non-specific serine/threonine protein kinase n=1 Tax=Adineta steineri TaxID=433720 RepID=A0A818QEW5_9BILA|nr:unnamed protein product [Adineta steineri]